MLPPTPSPSFPQEMTAVALETHVPRSRRSVLATALGGAAAAVGASLAGAQRVLAGASDGQVLHVGDQYLAVGLTTRLQNSSNAAEVFTAVSAGGTGLTGQTSSGIGVLGYSYSGTGVVASTLGNAGYGVDATGPFVAIRGTSTETGTTSGSGVGVFGTSASPDGTGVDGRSPNIGVHGGSAGIAVFGEATGSGIGVLGNSVSGRAVVGIASAATGKNVGVAGESFSTQGTGARGWAAGGSTGVFGYSGSTLPSSVPTHTGVYGAAIGGRGGAFAGDHAQVRLIPSTASSHPKSGVRGDLFVDKSGRLWFCKGGTSWRLIA
jgi:hypothetical protein